jgi:hypothetical protein
VWIYVDIYMDVDIDGLVDGKSEARVIGGIS